MQSNKGINTNTIVGGVGLNKLYYYTSIVEKSVTDISIRGKGAGGQHRVHTKIITIRGSTLFQL